LSRSGMEGLQPVEGPVMNAQSLESLLVQH
jgi:hypothetical protein